MRRPQIFRVLYLSALYFSFAALALAQGGGPVFRMLYNVPDSGVGGASTTMIEVSPGLFYGLSKNASDSGGGLIWAVTSAAKFEVFFSAFPTNSTPGTLVQAPDGLVWTDYYLSLNGIKTGNYVSMKPDGSSVHTYVTGKLGANGLVTTPAPPDYLYDITAPVLDQTYVFVQIDHLGNIVPLHEFSASDGVPVMYSPMVLAPNGSFYGVATQQYCCTPGWIFSLTPSGEFTKVVTFPKFPAKGQTVSIAAALDGNIYGVFEGGGANDKGKIFEVTPEGQLSTLVSFPATGINSPLFLTQFADGNLYGSTYSAPSYIFRFNFSTGQLENLYTMTSAQGQCPCYLTEGMDGKIYGVAPRGGQVGSGTIFSIDIGLPKPEPLVTQLVPNSGAAGSNLLLWGQYLLGATSVQFNGGPPQPVTVTSKQSVTVTVPSGATSGPITNTTANGSYTTPDSFSVQ